MPDLAQLNLVVQSDQVDKASKSLDSFTQSGQKAEDQAKKLESQTEKTNKGHEQSVEQIKKLIEYLGELAAVYEAVEIARRALEDAADEQKMVKAFTNITGSAEQAKAILEDLQSYSQNSQFALPGLEEDARLLLALGYNANQVVPAIKAIGDELTSLGGSSTSIDSIVQGLSRMQAEERVSTRAMLELQREGIPAWKILAQALGTDVPNAMILVRKGAVDSTAAVQALLVGMQKSAAGAKDQSRTIGELYNQLKNNLEIELMHIATAFLTAFNANAWVDRIINAVRSVSEVIDALINGVDTNSHKFDDLNRIITLVTGTLRILAEVLAIIVALKFAIAISEITVAMGPLLAVALLLTGVGLAEWFDSSNKSASKFVNTIKEAGELFTAFRGYLSNSIGDAFGDFGANDAATHRKMNDATDSEFTERWNAILDKYNRINAGQAPNPNAPGANMNGTQSITSDFTKLLESLTSANFSGIIKQIQEASKVLAPKPGGEPLEAPDKSAMMRMDPATQEQLNKMIEKVKQEQKLVSATTDDRKQQLEILQMTTLLQDKGLSDTVEGKKAIEEYTKALEDLQKLKDIQTIAKGVGDSLSKAMADFIDGAKKGKQAIRELLQALEQLAMKKMFEEPLSQAFSSGSTSLLAKLFGIGGGGGGDPTGAGMAQSNTASAVSMGGDVVGGEMALGGAFYRGVMMAFADGDVFDRPTSFGMMGGRSGVLGEAGPEAIMPLTRGNDGSLGVKMHGGGGGSTIINHNYYNNVNVRTNDADSFRRSKRQVASSTQQMFQR